MSKRSRAVSLATDLGSVFRWFSRTSRIFSLLNLVGKTGIITFRMTTFGKARINIEFTISSTPLTDENNDESKHSLISWFHFVLDCLGSLAPNTKRNLYKIIFLLRLTCRSCLGGNLGMCRSGRVPSGSATEWSLLGAWKQLSSASPSTSTDKTRDVMNPLPVTKAVLVDLKGHEIFPKVTFLPWLHPVKIWL